MPIRPEERARYPANWSEISLRVRIAAHWHCEWCGVKNGQLGGRDAQGTWWPALPEGSSSLGLQWPQEGSWAWCERASANNTDARRETLRLRVVRIVLTVAHLDHRPENCTRANLRALCQRCHNRHDAPHRRAGMLSRARAALGMPDLFAAEACPT